MDLPLGYDKQGEQMKGFAKKVCKLHKSIYGLKQASRQWNITFTEAIISFGFTQSRCDYSLFTRGSKDSLVVILLYVDDIIIAGPSVVAIDETKAFLHSRFKLRDLGPLKFFLGMEVAKSELGIVLSQRQYALQILDDYGFLDSKPVSTPMNPRVSLNSDKGVLLDDVTHYRSLIGRLLYLTISRPDITFSVNALSQFLQAPRDLHLQAVHHLLRYIKGSPGQGLLFPAKSSTQIRGFSDADWGGCLDTRRSVSGYCVFI